MSDGQTIFNLIVGVAVPIGLAIASALWNRAQKQSEELTNLRVEVARDYARTDKLDGLETKILARLDQIWEKIDQKADK